MGRFGNKNLNPFKATALSFSDHQLQLRHDIIIYMIYITVILFIKKKNPSDLSNSIKDDTKIFLIRGEIPKSFRKKMAGKSSICTYLN